MPYAISPNDIAQVTCRYAQANTVEMMNTFHFRYTGISVIADGRAALLELAQAVDATWDGAGWSTRWSANASDTVVIDRYIAQKVYPVRYGTVTWDVNVAGQEAASPLPSLVQWSITRKGDLATRYSRGGIRVPGLPDTFEVSGLLTAPAKANAAVIAETLKAPIEPVAGRTWVPVIYRRDNPGSSVAVVETFYQEVLRSQRSRISFRGI